MTEESTEARSFEVITGDPTSTVLVHVPHAVTRIPAWVRERIVLDDGQLTQELQLMTDARTDEVAGIAADSCRVRPWLFVNRLSRLVIDPERFPDPTAEPMADPAIGMGAVYVRTADGGQLRWADPAHDRALMDSYFYPYAHALSALVDERLDAVGALTLIDLHSFPLEEAPYERHHHADAERPELCIGADDFHTPQALVSAVADAFAGLGTSAVNAPFSGTYVPLNRYGTDASVSSVMVELRRDTYLPTQTQLVNVARMLATLVDKLPLPIPSGERAGGGGGI